MQIEVLKFFILKDMCHDRPCYIEAASDNPMRSREHAQTRPSPVPVALLLIDVLTTFQFPDGEAILEGALAMRDRLVRLKTRAREAGIRLLPHRSFCQLRKFGLYRSFENVRSATDELICMRMSANEDSFPPAIA